MLIIAGLIADARAINVVPLQERNPQRYREEILWGEYAIGRG